jgi:hypothetical protein
LRQDPILAKRVGFKDDPGLKEEEQIPLAKPVGWLPTREILDVVWQHRKFILEMLKSQTEELTDEQKARLEEIEKEQAAVINKFLPQ